MYDDKKFNSIIGMIDAFAPKSNKEGMQFSNMKDYIPPFIQVEEGENLEEIWNYYVERYYERNKKINIVKIGQNQQNIELATDSGSSWKIYERKLIQQKWTSESINTIRESSKEILSYLNDDRQTHGTTKGLVVGNVQSGKTANMAGVISMAADQGYNFFIVLTGTIENLRKQTSDRLFNDLNGSGNLNWQTIENPSLRASSAEKLISNFNLAQGDRNRYLSVCLKNKTRLQKLVKWLYSDVNKTRQLKILVIDDEADQASINTNSVMGEEDPTAINKLIKELVNNKSVKAMNYIAYTATPYANILNESGEDSLYPKNFIVVLPQSPDYIGPSEMFGTSEPEQYPKIDITREISPEDVETIKKIQKGEIDQTVPISFQKSIDWFILSLAGMRALGYQKPISMLVHTTFKVNEHEVISHVVESYLKEIRNNQESFLSKIEILYRDEKIDFSRTKFLENMKGYSTPNAVPNYPSWDDVREQIERIFRLEDKNYVSHVQISDFGQPQYHDGFHIAIDNSKANSADEIIRLVYPTKNNMTKLAPAFIVIGGNTLSRGLTIEGLVSTFFLRTTNQADTLMQMGRWFGYRKGYEIFPRVWLEYQANERFQFLSQLNLELRENLGLYAQKNFTPLEAAPLIKNSPDYQLIRITSQNKMQSAIMTQFNFSGFNPQTIHFKNDIKKLKYNIELTSKFLNELKMPTRRNAHLIWENVNGDVVEKFLKDYYIIEDDSRAKLISELPQWLKENDQSLDPWNVILSSKGNELPIADETSDWNIHGYCPKSVTRSKLSKASTKDVTSIGVLRMPADLIADIEPNKLSSEEKKASRIKEIRMLRETHGLGKTPLLVIYKIDKDSVPSANNQSGRREALNFDEDIIGINVIIPSFIDSKNVDGKTFADKLSIKISNEESFETIEEED
ncbi:TPA: Z1 domain-containing protein [Streptococcus suis]